MDTNISSTLTRFKIVSDLTINWLFQYKVKRLDLEDGHCVWFKRHGFQYVWGDDEGKASNWSEGWLN